MRVILWGINYEPEPTGIAPYTAGLARHLQSLGMDVRVVSGFAYYPAWAKEPGDRGCWHRRDWVNGVRVHRCWQYVPSRPSVWGRIAHELSFVLSSLWRIWRLPRADLYFVVSPPLGLGPAAWLMARLKRSRFLFHVQDLQPDSAATLGMLRAGLLLRLLYTVEAFTYRTASGVSAVSAGMVDALRAKGVERGKVHFLPNWTRSSAPAGAEEASSFRARQGISPWTFLAVYSGNLGRKQGLEVLIEAAAQLASAPRGGRPILILIAGDGAGRETLAQMLAERPHVRVQLLPLQSSEDHAAMMAAADVTLITQQTGTGRICLPSKLLSSLSAGRPVIAAADAESDLVRAVEQGGFGAHVPAGDAPALARLLHAAASQPEQVAEWARNTSWIRRYSPQAVLPRYEAAVLAAAIGETVGEITPARDAAPLEP